MNKSSFEQELSVHGSLVYKCKGSSMLPLLREDRDLAVIERKGEGRCAKYDVVLYRRADGTYVLHRILKVCADGYILCGDRCFEKEPGITDSQILGVMIAVLRDGKKHSVHSGLYWLYKHLWCDLFVVRAGILKSGAWIHRILRSVK